MSCEEQRGAGGMTVRVTGRGAGSVDEPLTLAVIDSGNKIVARERVSAGPDGTFTAAFSTGSLAAGQYRFGVFTAAKPPAVVGAGSFTIDRQGPAPAPVSNGQSGFFFRTFGLAIPGVAYTTDNYANNTRTLTVAPGAVTKSAVRVNPDGTYIWNSAWDGKIIEGRWRRDGAAIILLHAQSGRDWRMERMAQPAGAAEITLWDQNSIWYNGTPLAAR